MNASGNARVKARRRAARLGALLAIALATGALGAGPEVISRDIRSPEGPIFVDRVLYLVDYAGHDVVRLEQPPAKVIWHRDGCGPTGLARVPEGLLVACFDGKQVVTISLEGRTLATVENDETGQRLREPNDFALDAKGGVYVSGTGPWEPRPIVGRIYYRSADRRLRTVASDLHSPNGLVLSPDGKLLYVAESFASRILLFDVAPDGSLSGRREFVKLAEVLPTTGGRTYTPDGLRIDGHGNLFVGFWDGACFAVIGADGKLIKQVDLPAPHDPNLAITPDGAHLILTGVFDLPDNGSRGEVYRVPNPLAPLSR
ncbi:MAG TPA: SMP-30/gluconolactonase/LRE family protein [Burkholderiaceae bacterium]|nr:SMP-30/gluconolactonase/LRE family protein [Burkholderiaceae bacterium]